jgi:hypothetical protein
MKKGKQKAFEDVPETQNQRLFKSQYVIIQYTFIIPYWRLQVKHFRGESL